MDEAASTADDLGSVDPDVTPRAEPLVASSPGTDWRLCRLLIKKDSVPAEAFVFGGESE